MVSHKHSLIISALSVSVNSINIDLYDNINLKNSLNNIISINFFNF
jgi:hypothetical protein